jgi:hypothetical protein
MFWDFEIPRDRDTADIAEVFGSNDSDDARHPACDIAVNAPDTGMGIRAMQECDIGNIGDV